MSMFEESRYTTIYMSRFGQIQSNQGYQQTFLTNSFHAKSDRKYRAKEMTLQNVVSRVSIYYVHISCAQKINYYQKLSKIFPLIFVNILLRKTEGSPLGTVPAIHLVALRCFYFKVYKYHHKKSVS